MEGGAAAAALARVFCGFAGGVVVVAELFGAEAWALAAAAVGEDVAALVLLFWLHWWPPPHGVFCVQSLRKKRVESGLRVSFLVKSGGPAFGRAFFLTISILTDGG
jgi:hypothetical protein